ncbi:MAG TPA: fatty acid desaturase [Anaerolineales bacterium]|nr:fatty acid desaturase [Anaerolineales bacterium]
MNLNTPFPNLNPPIKLSWQKIVAKYHNSDLRRSLWQVFNSFAPFFVLWYLTYRSLEISYWLTLALTVPTAGFMMRIFIIFHDCGHGSFFKSQKANDFLGTLCGIVTFTPYHNWRRDHAIHHATSGDLDRRGIGDVKTLTVKEYLALPWYMRLGYRLYRHPFVLLVVGPVFLFVIGHRFATRGAGKRERDSVLWTNIALLAIGAILSWAIGFKQLLLIQAPLMVIACTVGVWLFYVQHQFEQTTWERSENWDYATAALYGSSFYKLPKVLQWFTGNIGFHHIHHLSPRIPNYELQKCHEENPVFHEVATLTFLASLKSITLRLWDEEQKKLVGFGHLKSLRQSA